MLINHPTALPQISLSNLSRLELIFFDEIRREHLWNTLSSFDWDKVMPRLEEVVFIVETETYSFPVEDANKKLPNFAGQRNIVCIGSSVRKLKLDFSEVALSMSDIKAIFPHLR